MRKSLGLLALLLASSPAGAFVQSTAVTVGASSAALLTIGSLPAGQLGPSAQYLFLQDVDSANTVACRLGQAALPTAALNTAGSFMLQPGQALTLITTQLGSSYLACIASGAGTNVTVILY